MRDRVHVHTIATHHEPHPDEVGAIWLLKRKGSHMYKGLRTAKIEFWAKDNRLLGKGEDDGYLCIGIGGGRFDEHGVKGQERKEGECAFTLMAKALGVSDEPELKPITTAILQNDLTGFEVTNARGDKTYKVMSRHLDFGDCLKVLWKAGVAADKVFEFAFAILDAKLKEQRQFTIGAQKVFNDPSATEVVTLKRVKNRFGRPLKVAVIKTSNREAAKYARSALGCRAAVVIQVDETISAVGIFTNSWNKLNLEDVVRIVRAMELESMGLGGVAFRELTKPGVIEDGKWHYMPQAPMLLNGSPTARGVPATNLNPRQLVYAVERGLDRRAFPEGRAQDCKQGVCSSSKADPCPWYCYGLRRCRDIRSAQYRERERARKERERQGDRKVLPMRKSGSSGSSN